MCNVCSLHKIALSALAMCALDPADPDVASMDAADVAEWTLVGKLGTIGDASFWHPEGNPDTPPTPADLEAVRLKIRELMAALTSAERTALAVLSRKLASHFSALAHSFVGAKLHHGDPDAADVASFGIGGILGIVAMMGGLGNAPDVPGEGDATADPAERAIAESRNLYGRQ